MLCAVFVCCVVARSLLFVVVWLLFVVHCVFDVVYSVWLFVDCFACAECLLLNVCASLFAVSYALCVVCCL